MAFVSWDNDDDLESVYPESIYPESSHPESIYREPTSARARSVSRSGNRTRVTISNRSQFTDGEASRLREGARLPHGLHANDDVYVYTPRERARARSASRHRVGFDARSRPELDDSFSLVDHRRPSLSAYDIPQDDRRSHERR